MGGTSSGGTGRKRPNEQLRSWFLRSGWSKGELARQVNRRAHQMGAHHVSTDTSRVRRWLDGEQPRDPIPRILSELFSERFGCVVAVEDLGLRPARQPAAVAGVDLPWTGAQTIALINEFSRGDLMLGRNGFLGSSLTVSAGPALIASMQRWLAPPVTSPREVTEPAAVAPGGRLPAAAPAPTPALTPTSASTPVAAASGSTATTTTTPGAPSVPSCPDGRARVLRPLGLSNPELQLLEQTIRMFRRWDAQCGGGLRRTAVVGQLHEVTDLLQESHPGRVRRRLFRITAELAELAGWMSYDVGLQPAAQKYFVLALHAAKEAGDRPFGAYVLANMSRQLIHLGRGEDALELIHLAQYGSRDTATPRTQAMLHALEARAHATIGQPGRCRRAARMAEDTFADCRSDDGDPDWIRFFTEAELNAENAHSYRDLAYSTGRAGRYAALAEPVMARAVTLFAQEAEQEGGYQRSYALNLVGLASVRLLQGEPVACAELVTRALEVARLVRSERVDNRIRCTAAAARREFGEVAEVAQLGERLDAQMRAATATPRV